MYSIAMFIDIDFLLCATLFCENVNTSIEHNLKKKATQCTKVSAYAGSGFFTQEAVFKTWIRDLPITWQQIYQLRQGYPSNRT